MLIRAINRDNKTGTRWSQGIRTPKARWAAALFLAWSVLFSAAQDTEPVVLSYDAPTLQKEVQDLFSSSRQASPSACKQLAYELRAMPFRKRLNRKTKFEPGVGALFADHPTARLGTGGAGVEEPHWVYVKVSFRF
ncbi:MAG TPA: hypothetical protein VLT36_17735 [Candidatus Dormibacteraeota bacterium]|nr:hypothetical protein [Candidatus Dormibacteraeota bacterium]